MLPRVVPQARVWVYDYNSNCWSDQAGTVTLLAHGDVFLDLLWATMAMDQQIGRRPLIFIGSCFGGIVVAQVGHSSYPLWIRCPVSVSYHLGRH